MNTNFRALIGDATRLTRSGDLSAATDTIRRALGQGVTSPAADPERDGAQDARARDESILDGEWRRVGSGAEKADVGPAPAAEDARTAAQAAKAAVRAAVQAATQAATEAARSGQAGRTTGPVRAEAANGKGVTRARHVDARGGSLDYRLYVPPLAADAPPPALVVMLHGCTQDADDFATGTGMDALAREHGFIALYPEQSGRANPQRCWNWFKHVHQRRGRGEPGLIEGIVRDVVAAHGVDPARVFVAGLSAGGAMAAILGESCPELFAAVGIHSGLVAGAATDLPGAMAAMHGGQGARPARATPAGPATPLPPTIVFHGDADRTVHPDNGERIVAACVDAASGAAGVEPTLERRAGGGPGRGGARDGLGGSGSLGGARSATRQVFRDGAGAVVAEHWLVHGAAHAWSGGDPRGSYTDAGGPDASAEMVRFFLDAGDR